MYEITSNRIYFTDPSQKILMGTLLQPEIFEFDIQVSPDLAVASLDYILMNRSVKHLIFNPLTVHYLLEEFVTTGRNVLSQYDLIPLTLDQDVETKFIRILRLAQDPSIPRRVIRDNLPRHLKHWVKESRERILQNRSSDPNPYKIFLLFGEEYLFPSGRTRTTMEPFRSPNSPILHLTLDQILQLRNGEILQFGLSYLPVSRYGQGMSRGLYYKTAEEGKSYCGTFYYFEPGSTVVLSTSRPIGIYFNKVDAFLELIPKVFGKSFQEIYREIGSSSKQQPLLELIEQAYRQGFENRIVPILRGRLQRYNLRENILDLYIKFMRGDSTIFQMDQNYMGPLKPSGPKEYIEDFYATEDDFDQVICILARYAKIDLLILTNMPGSSRIVKEVLDVRSREESIEALSWLE